MIKNIAYFPSQCAKNSLPVMEAFARGCAANGIDLQQDSMRSDAAVIWSVLWSGRMQANQAVYEHYRAQGRPVICIDIGALHRGTTWKIALNNINAQGYYGHDQDLDLDRPRRLQLKFSRPKQLKSSVLVALQHPASLQVQAVDQVAWAYQQIQTLRSISDLPVVVRAHPRGKLGLEKLQGLAVIQTARHVAGTYDSFDIDFDYRVVINYNSGVGVQAALAGTTVSVDSTSLAHPLSIDLKCLDTSPAADRDQWLIGISHTEYLLEEIAQGTWLKRIGHQLEL